MARLLRILVSLATGGYIPGVDRYRLEDTADLYLLEDSATDHYLME